MKAFLELIESINVDAANGVTMFPIAELTKLFNERRQNFNLPKITRPTSLKERILTAFKGDLTEQGTEQGPKTFDGLNRLVKEALEACVILTKKSSHGDLLHHTVIIQHDSNIQNITHKQWHL